ncbi:MAG: 1,4-dihydroxy-2-naphthoate polyprenyltransferase [Planctomycetales bacterium]|nr:1,4-dihydroxy-2-naphthoate polyprenyltransferase [Planctomycetales bacterium]
MKHWLLAARPKTLMAGLCPVLMGTALAVRDDAFHALAAFMALVGGLAIQIGTNFCNDYCDYFQGADTDQRKGPTRAVQAGLVSPNAMLGATACAFAVAAAASGYLTIRAGWGIAILAVCSIAFGVLYTAGRYSLAYLGLGDPFVLVFFGPVAVAGTYFVQAKEIAIHSIVAGLAPGAIATGLLVVNNLRDINEDRLAGKRTLAVRFGKTFVRSEYAFCILVAIAVPIVLWAMFDFSPWTMIASVFALPGMLLVRAVFSTDGSKLNPFLGKTAALLLAYSIVFSLGVTSGW